MIGTVLRLQRAGSDVYRICVTCCTCQLAACVLGKTVQYIASPTVKVM
jgi:hypothetical protein